MPGVSENALAHSGDVWVKSNLTLPDHLHQTLHDMPLATMRMRNHNNNFHLLRLLLQTFHQFY